MKKILCCLALLCLSPLVLAQSVTMPDKVKIERRANGTYPLATVTITYDGTGFQYGVIGGDADVFREFTDQPNTVRLRIMPAGDGIIGVVAYCAKEGKTSPFTVCTITVGTPAPPIPPVPPVPPVPPIPPIPPVPPVPPNPAPIPVAGFRVLILYESADLSKMPLAQRNVIFSKAVRDYLDAKCVLGPDGKTKEWRMWDKDVQTAGEATLWRDAAVRPRASVPWIIISTGVTGYEGPLPGTPAETLAVLQKFGG